MKSLPILAISLACALWSAPALAQHGHPGGMGGGMGDGDSMNHGAANHGMNAAGNTSTSHGQVMNDILTRNTQLADKIQHLTGMTAQQACDGFKNLGQCIAAAHVSQNLGISFSCLRADMTGTTLKSSTACPTASATAGKSMSLGKAIQTLSPNSDAKAEAKKASKQADNDIKDSNS